MNRSLIFCFFVWCALLGASSVAMAQDNSASNAPAVQAAADKVVPVVIEPPQWDGGTLQRDKSIKQVSLKQKSKKKNDNIGMQKWFSDNQLQLDSLFYAGDIPMWVPKSIAQNKPQPDLMKYNDLPLMAVFASKDTQVYAYGARYDQVRTLQIVKNGKVTHIWDFSNFKYSPKTTDREFGDQRITWVVVEDDIVYVQHSSTTYAKSSGGQVAYISAISMKDNKIIWTTQPLTANGKNFIISGNSIISGYGFTAEPDFLYVVDKFSGERVQTIKLKSGADYIIERDGMIYVRTYNDDYVFSIK